MNPNKPTEPTSTAPQNTEPDSKKLIQRPLSVLILTALVICGIVYGAYFLWQSFTHESTDDAFVDSHIVAVAPKIAGRVSSVNVRDNQEVKKGDLLVEIDPRDYDSVVTQKKAALEVATAQLHSSQASEQQAQAHVQTVEAAFGAAKAAVDSAETTTKRQHSDLERNQKLSIGGAISPQELEHSRLDTANADANLQSKVSQVSAAEAYMKEAESQLKVSASQVAGAEAELGRAKAELAQAELQRSYTKIVAPEDGRITNKAVEPGSYVQVGQALLALVPKEVWITANFKESQIGKMRPGQPATIRVDAYPGQIIQGHVDSIQAGSGARFSLLPPENATGNFVKVVQRVPVKIVFDEKMEQLLGPGMSAVPEVEIPASWGSLVAIVALALVAIVVVLGLAQYWLRKIQRSVPVEGKLPVPNAA